MPTALTNGYSLAALVPESILAQVFSRAFLQQLPGLSTDVGQGRQLTLWFSAPLLTLTPKPFAQVNSVMAEIGFLARMTGQYDEVSGTIQLRTAVTQVRTTSGTQSFVVPIVDFRTTAPDSFTVVGLSDEQRPVWGPAITAAFKPALERISPFTAGPLLPDTGAEYFLVTDPATPYGAGDGVLGVFVWSDPGSAPDPPTSLAPRNVRADRAVALVPRDRVDQAIAAGLAANGLTNLPADVQGVTISAFAIDWHEFGVGGGHFYIHGTVDHWTGDVNFEAWIQLIANGSQVQINVLRTRHDTGWVGDVLDLFSGGAITRTLEQVLPRAVSGVGGGAFGTLGVFATGSVPQAQAFATMDVRGPIDVWPDGLGVPARLLPTAGGGSSFPPPQYLRGHESTREFHTADCQYGRLIKQPWRFPTWQRAVQRGYNGCWYCQGAFNVVAAGRLVVEVTGPVQPMPTVSARLVSQVTRFGVIVAPLPEKLVGKFGWVEAEGVRHYVIDVLVPGTWEVTATLGAWTVTAAVEVGKAWYGDGQPHGVRTHVHLAVGSAAVTSEQVTLPE